MAVKFSRNVGLYAVIISFYMVWIFSGFCLAIKRDPRSQFYRHVVVQPDVYIDGREKSDLRSIKEHKEEKLTIGFTAFNKTFMLNLVMNKRLLPSHYFEKHHMNGSHVTNFPMKYDQYHCHYQGDMTGVNNSWAAISTCNGISGVIYDGKEMYYIQPNGYDDERHVVFRSLDFIAQNFTCGYSDSVNSVPQDFKKRKRIRRSAVVREPYKSNQNSSYVELIIVNDNKEFKEFNQDKKAVFERSKMIANIVNGLYSSLNIFIVLVGVIVWSERDEIELSSDADATLSNFLRYRKERLTYDHPNDNAQLITALTFDAGIVGKALRGPICSHEYSGGVNMDHSHVIGLVATTVAHELGHNLGMEHDDPDKCQCPDEKCIMAPSSSQITPRHWSSCSAEYLQQAFSQGMDYCLKNFPDSVIGPDCGNGILDDGEECDCGLAEFCDSHCCNATTCQLFKNATCAMGTCCNTDTCQLKKISTLCRHSVSECDLPEYCNGASEFCPADTFLQNGVKCNHGQAYCFDGHCQSHDDQCKLLWGKTGKMSAAPCYEQNYKGNVNGNCGYNRINQTYEACRKEDVLCGMLHCTYLNEKLEFGLESAAILARSFINFNGKVITCRSAIIDLGLFSQDPGLAPNGAKCGDGKVCVNQKCIPVNSAQKNTCLYECSGNGVCNNRGNCHCDVGYAPPYCHSSGPGGSIDSGPASDPSRSFVVVILYVVLCGVLPLMILSAAAIYYFRSNLKAWWSKKIHKANIKSRTQTTTQRKVQPPAKFNFNKNNLQTLEISAPVQNFHPAMSSINHTSTLSHKQKESSLHQIQASQTTSKIPANCFEISKLNPVRPAPPKPPSEIKNIPVRPAPLKPPESKEMNTVRLSPLEPENKEIVPVRPAPPKPESTSKRMPSNASTTASSVAKTSSFRSTNDRPSSGSTFRPNCPPPRPPAPKKDSFQQDRSLCSSEGVKSNETKESTSVSSLYDDCQTLEFPDNPYATVHMEGQKSDGEYKNCEVSYRKPNQNFPPENNSLINKDLKLNKSAVSKGDISEVSPPFTRTIENSVVAELTQRFEKKDNASKNDSPLNVSLRPPFKSRPLPPRPDDPKV